MARSRSKKMRDKAMRQKGYDIHEMKRGVIAPPVKLTPNRDEFSNRLQSKHKKRNLLRDGEDSVFISLTYHSNAVRNIAVYCI